MTLNINVTTPRLMIQTCDLMLSVNGKPAVNPDGVKMAVLMGQGWNGVITYTGVARFGEHDTAVWLMRTLGDISERLTTPRDVAELIATRAGRWMNAIPVSQRIHTFTLAAYVDFKPEVYYISTFERPNGARTTKQGMFTVSVAKPREPWAAATGQSDLINVQRRHKLAAAADSGWNDPNGVARLVAETSRDAPVSAQR